MAHKLESAILDGIEDVQYFDDWTEMLKGLYKHYHYSPKALANIMDESYNHPVNVSGSRWVPHNFHTLKVVCKNYKVTHAPNCCAATSIATMQG